MTGAMTGGPLAWQAWKKKMQKEMDNAYRAR